MSNFLAQVIQARDANTGDEFREMLQNVDVKISQLQTDLIESLQSCFVLYDADIDRVTSWYVEVQGINDNVADLQKQFHQDKKALQSATEDIESVSDDLHQCERRIMLLKALVDVVRNVEKADTSDIYRTSKLMRTAQEDFRSISESFNCSEDHDWVVGIRSTILDIITDVYEKTSTELWSVFNFGKHSLTINIQNASAGVDQLVKTLVNIGYCSKVVNKLSVNLWDELMKKACSPNYSIEITGLSKPAAQIQVVDARFKNIDRDAIPVRDCDPQPVVSIRSDNYTNQIDSSSLIIIKAIKLEKPISDIEKVFCNITKIISIFSNDELFGENIEVMEEIARILGPRICEELGNKSIKTLILRNAEGDINQARNNIAVMHNFVDNLSAMHFEFPRDTILDELESEFDTLFLSQVRQDLLVKIRDLIKANVHDTREIEYDNVIQRSEIPEEIAALHRNPLIFPRCVISKSVAEIVRVLKGHIRRYPEDIAMCDAAFNLYISLVKVPKHESEAGDLVPFSAVLIHNNSYYLAHQAGFAFPMCEDKVPELRTKGNQAYSFMMRSIRTKLNSMIADAMAGIVTDEASDTEISKFLKISAEFDRLDNVFKPVLPSTILSTTLATLVDHTVNEMCFKVLSWDDISANSANQLASAFTQFAVETSDLFKGDASNPREVEALTVQCVSKWSRFRLLTFVLTASMKEIEDKWVEGCGPLAMEFKAEEVRKLVRALFQNTDRRAAFLASIK